LYAERAPLQQWGYNGRVAVMGIDFGNRRVGIALSESEILATPHLILLNDGDLDSLIDRIRLLAVEIGASRVILGAPRRPSGTDPKYQAFADRIEASTGLPVLLWDESYSTIEASELRRQRDGKMRRRRNAIDDEAAAVILQSWLDAQNRREP